jgi:hypothetical protein
VGDPTLLDDLRRLGEQGAPQVAVVIRGPSHSDEIRPNLDIDKFLAFSYLVNVKTIKGRRMELSPATTGTAGILLLTIVLVEYGGTFMFRLLRAQTGYTDFQRSSFRAGHAHAGVLVMLSLVALLYADAIEVTGIGAWAGRSAIPLAAILMPAGFFFSAMGEGRTSPNRLRILVYLGAVSLAIGVVSLGIALLVG